MPRRTRPRKLENSQSESRRVSSFVFLYTFRDCCRLPRHCDAVLDVGQCIASGTRCGADLDRISQVAALGNLCRMGTLAGQVGANPLALSTADRPVLGSSPFRSFTHKHHEYPHEDHLQNEANHDNHVSE